VAVAAFLDTGNVISVANSLCPCSTPGGGGITVAGTAWIGQNPLKGPPGSGSLQLVGNAAVIQVVGNGKVTIKAP